MALHFLSRPVLFGLQSWKCRLCPPHFRPRTRPWRPVFPGACPCMNTECFVTISTIVRTFLNTECFVTTSTIVRTFFCVDWISFHSRNRCKASLQCGSCRSRRRLSSSSKHFTAQCSHVLTYSSWRIKELFHPLIPLFCTSKKGSKKTLSVLLDLTPVGWLILLGWTTRVGFTMWHSRRPSPILKA